MFVMWAVLEKFTRVWGLDKLMMEGSDEWTVQLAKGYV